ncbi:hypothetical protein LB505_013663 [Fusarium chuoi]|nr:hypothetical protein LB505_013663 [Fusarium chuoi]
MSENNNIRPYLMPAFQETPSSQRAVQRRPLPSSAPKRTAAHMDEHPTQERCPQDSAWKERGSKVQGEAQ